MSLYTVTEDFEPLYSYMVDTMELRGIAKNYQVQLLIHHLVEQYGLGIPVLYLIMIERVES